MANDELLLRQQQLLTRSAELRLELAQRAQVLTKPLAMADRARELVHWLASNPAWPAGAALALIVLRPRRALVWGGRLWWGWQSYRQARRWIQDQG